MATINNMSMNNSISSLFSNYNTSTSKSNSSTISLSDYAAIKNGSYKKLMSAYYSSDASKGTESTTDTSSLVKSLSTTSSDATSLAERTSALLDDKSLYEKKDVVKKDEKTGEKTTTNDYDWDKITDKVKKFIDAYNDTIEDAGESTTRGVLQNALWMTKTTAQNKNLLSQIGISVGGNNKLQLDEDELKKASMSTIKSVFASSTGYASQIQYKALQISNAAQSSASAYSKNGKYNTSYSSAYNTIVQAEHSLEY